MPEIWWEDQYRNTNGYFGSDTTFDSTGSCNGINTWSRFLVKKIGEPAPGTDLNYKWLKFNLFTRWLPSTNQMVFLVFDPLPDVKGRIYARLKKAIPDSQQQQRDHFWVHSQILHDFVDLQHRSVWGIRNHVRTMEKAQNENDMTPNFRRLHDLARHSIHICETLELACISMDELLEFFSSSSLFQHTHAVGGTDEQRTAAVIAAAVTRTASQNQLQFQRHVLRSFRLRAQANKERLQNEIGLAFNNIAQQNALLAVEIGKATRTDGLAVKTIAFVTFAFLPATLICAIFSMPFFELESGTGELLVSDKFWMYWAVTIPVTLLAPLLWGLYSRLSLPQDAEATGKGEYGLASAAVVATNMLRSFPNIRIGLMVGIAGGAPRNGHDIRLGDVVVSARTGAKSAVFQYDYGKAIQNEPFTYTQLLNQPPAILRAAVTSLSAQHQQEGHDFESQIARLLQKPRLKKYRRPPSTSDKLCKSDVVHSDSCSEACGGNPNHLAAREPRGEDKDDPTVHYGIIASANQLMKDANTRDKLAAEHDVLCFEMEAAGLMNNFPCLVIRGICDYSDSHKNKEWQGFAAMMAAAYAKALLGVIVPDRIAAEQTIKETIFSMEKTVNIVEKKVNSLQSNAHIAELKQWLSPADASTNANRAKELHHPGTGTWLLENQKFKEWQDGSRRQLWLRALAGCGKTVLCAAVLEHLAKLDDCVVLSFFFDFGDTTKQTFDGMMRALIFQLYQDQPEPKSRGYLDSLFQTHSDGQKEPTAKALWDCLQNMLAIQKRVYVVLDALDESKTRDRLTKWIKDVVSGPTLQRLHLIFTSRPEPDFDCIPSLIGRDNCLELDKKAANADIHAYVLSRLHNDDGFVNKSLPVELIQDIGNRIGNGADGIWAFCQMQTLAECASVFDIKSALGNLPRDLEETYTRMMENIPEPFKKAAIRLLTFLVHCERPLELSEGKDVIATIETEPEGFDCHRRPFDEAVFRHCPGMITSIVAVTHLLENGANVNERGGLFGNALQAASYKGHANIVKLLLKNGANVNKKGGYFGNALQAASNKGQVEIVNILIENGADLDAPGGAYINALQAASHKGYTNIVKLLLKNGANVNKKGGHLGNALQAALHEGHLNIAKLLLDKGADINTGGRDALEAASLRNNTGIVKLLIEKGLDVKAQGGAALQIAFYEGHVNIVKLLLDNGAYIDARSGTYSSSLRADSYRRRVSMVERLSGKHRNFYIQGGEASEAAFCSDYTEIFKLWIEEGVDVKVQDGEASEAAFCSGYTEIVKLLIEKGVDIKVQGGAALQPGFYTRYEDVLKLLLDNGP
ncbi:hypothetical protein PpBr36_03495 [Pyricularia pennisetigena]|uniref:hypothetical protein n=1 Tax=Pyricularia pennisetigena TaxID=1578925 RepID=UPI0011516191|nr:hypothetical protein PpBr36_03495 [Pyricularia pennisetigena]TLS31007.1 hypothetical protein PpBr36_03495 [Pyricularia pennisetigena]